MTIAFLGVKGSISYIRIGGCESIVRRLSHKLEEKGHKVYIITYQEENKENTTITSGIERVKLQTFNDVISFLKENNILNVLTFFVAWKDRPRLFFFTLFNSAITFSTIITNYKTNIIKRLIFNIETALNYRKGIIYCSSPRLLSGFSLLSKSNSKLLIPPVDDDFFTKTKNKTLDKNKTLHIAYMGRLDYGKGSDIAIKYFENSKLDNVTFHVFGYPHKTDPFSVKQHDNLNNQKRIKYHETKVNNYSPAIDTFLKETIDQIDVFVLPYRFVHSTIDSPLVPLEIMARKTLYLTTDVTGMEHLIIDKKLVVDIEKDNIDDQLIEIKNNPAPLEEALNNLQNKLSYKAHQGAELIEKSLR